MDALNEPDITAQCSQ